MTPEAVLAELARIVESPGFRAAGRLAPFLTFVVERTLAGEPLKESILGVEVFGRPAEYDPRLDPIVRVEARRLRARLAEYYAGPGALDPVVIEIPKGTYAAAFLARAEEGGAPAPETPPPAAAVQGRRRFVAWAAAAALVAAVFALGLRLLPREAAAPPSVAVLPFANLGASRADDAFSEGVAEEVLGRLAQIRGLRVVARSSSFQFAGRALDLRDVGRRLGATAVVEGSVRRAGDRLRVSAQLVSVASGFQLWSQTYERSASDVFVIQDDVARSVANALRVELKVGLEPRAQAPTASLGAFELYAQGRYHLNHDALAGLELAVDSFERATGKDPRYAAAQAALAQTYALLAYYRLRPHREAWNVARQAAERALALDGSLAEAHAVLGLAKALDEWKWDEAEPFFLRALEMGPDSCDVRIAYVWGLLLPRGRLAEARAQVDRAVELDPSSSLAHKLRSFVLLIQGDWDVAVESYRRAAQLDPAHGDVQWDLGMALAFAGKKDEAMRQFRIGGSIHNTGAFEPGAAEWALLGEEAKAREALADWPGKNQERPLFVAYAYGLLGDAEAAADWLERAYAERDPQLMWAKVDPRLAKVRADARIQAVVRSVGL
jgi:TolB-like protein/Tfp pilus assembly protein PilF